MTVTNIYEAKAKLPHLINRALSGEKVVIARSGKPAVVLTPYTEEAAARQPGGSWQEKVWMADDFDELPPEFIDAFQGCEQ